MLKPRRPLFSKSIEEIWASRRLQEKRGCVYILYPGLWSTLSHTSTLPFQRHATPRHKTKEKYTSPCSLGMGPIQQTGRTGSGLLTNLPPCSVSPLTACFSVTRGDFRRRVAKPWDHQIKVPSENSGEHHESYIHTQLEAPSNTSQKHLFIYYPLYSAWISGKTWTVPGSLGSSGARDAPVRSPDPIIALFAG